MKDFIKGKRTILLGVVSLLFLSGFRSIWINSAPDTFIQIPSLDHLTVPPDYYTPNPKTMGKGDWVRYDLYYDTTDQRIWNKQTSPEGMTVTPTNDWFQVLACWPNPDKNGVIQARGTTGHYVLSWNGPASNGMHFECPSTFAYYPPAPSTPLAGHFTFDIDKTVGDFCIVAPNSSENPTIEWLPSITGNMLRAVHYPNDAMILYIVQGGVFQGAKYNNCNVHIQIPKGTGIKTKTVNGMTRHVITGSLGSQGNQYSYVVYTPSSEVLQWNGSSLTSANPYTGYLNIACIPTSQLTAVQPLLDQYANAVVVKADGTFSTNTTEPYDYELSYSTVDLAGGTATPEPLVLLMHHHLNKAELVSGQKPTYLFLATLKGSLTAFGGSSFQFKFPAKYDSLTVNPLPSPGITQAQAEMLISKEVLDKGIADAIKAPAPPISIPYNKFVYQKALTLAYAQEVIKTSGQPNKWEAQLEQLRQSLIQGLDNIWSGTAPFQETLNGKKVFVPSGIHLDRNWGTMVFFPDSYGSAQDLNDHIVQYGYIIYSLVLLDQYEKAVGITTRYLDQTSKAPPYTNRDLGTLLAADLGQSGGDNFINHRNLDFYEGHSWLSGLENSLDGQNTESESEALLGSMSVLAWLENEEASDELQCIARNRWMLETTAYESYWQVDPQTSPYIQVCPDYVCSHLTASIVWQHKIDSSTYWGLEWDRLVGAIFMPTSANLLDNFLGDPSATDPIVTNYYGEAIAKLINSNWSNDDTSNPIQSVLVSLVAHSAQDPGIPPIGLPGSIQHKLDDLNAWRTPTFNPFDPGTNEFLLSVIGMYAQNKLK